PFEVNTLEVNGNQITFKIKPLTPTAIIPTRSTQNSAGYDLYSDETIILQPNQTQAIKTGIACQFPKGTYGDIKSRSSYALKGLEITTGTIDEDYTGEIKVVMKNATNKPIQINK